jgi:hypothetical protein
MMRLQWVALPEFNNFRENLLPSTTPQGSTLPQVHVLQWSPHVEEVDLTGEDNVEVDNSVAEQDVEDLYTTDVDTAEA